MEVTCGATFTFPNTPMSKYSTRQGSSLQTCGPKSTCAWSYRLTTAHIFRSPITTPQSLMCSIKIKKKLNKQTKKKQHQIQINYLKILVGVRPKCNPIRRRGDFFFTKPIFHTCRFHSSSISWTKMWITLLPHQTLFWLDVVTMKCFICFFRNCTTKKNVDFSFRFKVYSKKCAKFWKFKHGFRFTVSSLKYVKFCKFKHSLHSG